jgi:cobalamin biosynthesis protein CobC
MTSIRHGGELSRIQARHPDAPKPWLDLSTGLNPQPWSWQENVSPNDILAATTHLPDQDKFDFCRNAWTRYLKTESRDEWTLAAGSQAVINLLPHIFPDHGVCLPDPTYGEHVRVWQKAGRPVSRIDATELLQRVFPPRQVLIVTNPNNPDGYLFDPDDLVALAAGLHDQDSYLIVDEAFCDVLPQQSLAGRALPSNIILLRSLGKFFGLAGLRIGMFRAAGGLREEMRDMLGPWQVNGPALLIAGHALQDENWIVQTRQRLKQDGERLRKILSLAGLQISGSTDLFCLTRYEKAAEVAETLARNGIYVRSFVEDDQNLRFGLPAADDQFLRLQSALDTCS